MITTPRHLASAIIAGLCALLLVGCGPTTYTVDEHIDRAQQAHAEGNLRAAIIEIKNALQQEPSRAEARRLLGSYNLEIGDAVAAESELVRAGELGEDPDQVRLLLARAWLMQGKTDQVIEETRLSDSFPEPQLPEALTLRGWALLARGETMSASEVLQQALEQEPDNAEALLGMAWVELLAGRSEQARQRLDAALASDPEFDRAWELLGDLERDARQLAAAEAAYTRAIESTHLPFNPRLKRALTRISLQNYENANSDIQVLRRSAGQHPAVSYASGLIAFQQQRYDEARADFEESLSRNAAYMPAVFYLGATHYALNNWRQAESYLTRYVAQFPDATEASRLLALTRLQEGDSERAERTLRAVLERDPEDRETLAMMSNLYLSQGRTDEALHHMRQVAALEPDSAATRVRLGMALMQQGQREEALQELEAAIALDPEGVEHLEAALVMEHIQAGEFQRALEAAKRLRDRDDFNPATVANLIGTAQLGLGDHDAARAAFQAGLDQTPNHISLALNLGMLELRQGNRQTAIEIFETLQEYHPGQPDSAIRLAGLALQQGEITRARRFLAAAVEHYPEEQQPHLMLARLQLETGQGLEAAETLQAALEHHPEDRQILFALSEVYERTERFQEAAEVLALLTDLEPGVAEMHFRLARTLTASDDQPGAEQALRRALTVNPGHVPARVALVRRLSLAGELEEARSLFAPLLESHAERPDVLAQQAWFQMQAGEYLEAARSYGQALEGETRRAWVLERHQALMNAGQTDEAIATLQNWLERRPEDHAALHLLGSVLLSLERNVDAIELYTAQLEQQPRDVIALNNLAWLLREQDTTKALEYAQRARALAPDQAIVLDTLGVVMLYSGDSAQAVEILNQAKELTPDSPTIAYHLAMALKSSGQIDNAINLLRAVLHDHDSFPERESAETLLRELSD